MTTVAWLAQNAERKDMVPKKNSDAKQHFTRNLYVSWQEQSGRKNVQRETMKMFENVIVHSF
jgi:hypothetical protein